MDAIVRALVELLDPNAVYILGSLALVIVLVPRLVEFRGEWVDVRLGRRKLETEKLRLEVLKLRADVEKLAKHEAPGISGELQAISAIATSEATPRPSVRRVRWGLSGWLARHPRIGRPVMLFAQLGFGYVLIISAVMVVAAPMLLWKEKDFGPARTILITVVYAAFSGASYLGFKHARSFRKEVISS